MNISNILHSFILRTVVYLWIFLES